MMQLRDEDRTSVIDGDEYLAVLTAVLGGFKQAAPWIGGYRPETNTGKLKNLEKWNQSHYEVYLWFIENHMDRPGEVLDIGCGSGARSKLLSRYSDHVVAIEHDQNRYKFACEYNSDPKIRYINGTFPANKPEGLFDYVFCVSVLYQGAANPQKIVRAAIDSLKPGGKFFVYDNVDAMKNITGAQCRQHMFTTSEAAVVNG